MNKFYRLLFISSLINFLLVLPSFSEGFTKGKVKIPFEPKVELKSNKITAKSKTDLLINFKVEDGSYIYKDSITVKVDEVNGVKVGTPVFPKAEKKLDKFSNQEREIYHNSFIIKVPVEVSASAKLGKLEFSSIVGYQGCSKTICFIPQEKNIKTSFEIVKKK